MNVILFSPKATPDVELMLATPQSTDEFMAWFCERGYVDSKEALIMSWIEKKQFIRYFINELLVRKKKNALEALSERLADLGTKDSS